MFKDKTLLITGGTGSFGNAVMERFLDSDIKEIRIFSRDEKKQDDMRKYYNNDKIKFFIGDVRDAGSIRDALYGVDYVFHAAALKQVPSCEFFPMEAVKTNIIGTDNLLNECIRSNVQKVIALSTDKAAYPINSMGISKAMMEKVVIAKSRTVNAKEKMFCCTRYGNVMASRGSVIPLFIEQIKVGKPLTLTNPEMTRFMMSLTESVDLVLYAFEHGVNGDIFVQKAPAATVEVLAKALLSLFDAQNQIRIIGTRHGEKQYESLLTKEEFFVAQDLGTHYRVPADNRDLNYDKFFIEGEQALSTEEEYNSNNTILLSIEEMKDKLLTLDYVKGELTSWKKMKSF